MSDPQKCQRCGAGPDPDLRTLRMACFYEMDELGLPFMKLWNHDVEQNFYSLRVCKTCRATWMDAIKQWFNNVEVRDHVGSGIFVRRNGATVEVTEEEWRRTHPDREPVRVMCPSCQGTKKILEDHDGRAGYRPCTECE